MAACLSSQATDFMHKTEDPLAAELNRETAKIAWRELERFYARGVVIEVDAHSDLIEVAAAMRRDDTDRVENWLQEGAVVRPDDTRARQWSDADSVLWAVVVAPWVLVQEPTPANPD